MAKELAREVGYVYVDTGAMYRTVTLFALDNGLITEDGEVAVETLNHRMNEVQVGFVLDAETNLPLVTLNGVIVEDRIRGMAVSEKVSLIAALPFVREAMTKQQQLMGKEKGLVMDGRDIGTVVFPKAELKIFVTASPEVRAERRFKELKAKNMTVDFNEILANVKERDYIDSHRETAPLRQAPDALLLDNSQLTREEQRLWLLEQFHKVAD
ncbi:MAG: (d)CMP kinase [Prevotellamassilia sp.]|nr:(d)CMP kinase [Prevotellamassilia sp.]